MKYRNIVFVQGEEAEKVLNILDKQGEEAALNYLLQWNYGDSPEEEREDQPWGNSDIIYKKDNFVMSYNEKIGYAGLIEVI